jgi:cobalt-zinc-cadmium efflux system protein
MMGHMHQHYPSHHHGQRSSKNRQRLALTLGLAALYFFAEVVGGIWSNSLALLADAGHMFSDIAALGLSLFAVWLASRPAPAHRTYGYYRAEILAALANGSTLIAVAFYIFVESYQRFREPPEVQSGLMMAVAVGGLVVNLAGLFILHGGRQENLNVRGAWLHVLSDALGSVGAIVAGALIWAYDWNWVDPVASALIGILLIHASWQLVRESVSVLMENAPYGVDVDEVHAFMRTTPGIASVHDLHIWSITSGLHALSAHVTTTDASVQHAQILRLLREGLHNQFDIDHVTIQIEPDDYHEECDMVV